MSFFNDVNQRTVSEARSGFPEFKVGDNYAYISKVEEKKSRSDKPMVEITFTDENGATIRYWIVEGEWKFPKLKELYLSFGIPLGERDIKKWIGKWGIVVCKAGESTSDGKIYNQVSYVKADNDVPQNRKPNQQQQQPPRGYDDTGDEFGNANHQEEEFTDDIAF